MTIKIIRREQEYSIVNEVEEDHGIILEINCAKQIRNYNEAEANTDRKLYDDIATAINNEDANLLTETIKDIMVKYRLNRREAFVPENMARVIMENRVKIGNPPEVNNEQDIDITCERIYEKFQSLNKHFCKPEALNRQYPLPEVSFSKVLHFVRPESFWIVDSRVKTALNMWGYKKSLRGYPFPIFHAFGQFLKDLFNSNNFEGFKCFATDIDNQQVSFLKIIDKILWWRRKI